jgi:hypothetical protein
MTAPEMVAALRARADPKNVAGMAFKNNSMEWWTQKYTALALGQSKLRGVLLDCYIGTSLN